MPTILCVDDDEKLLELYSALLERQGYLVLTARNGPDGIALARQKPVDTIVLDFNLPGMNGADVAQLLSVELPNVPVVIWSGSLELLPESLRWFADAILHKGDGPETLVRTIECLLKKSPLAAPAK